MRGRGFGAALSAPLLAALVVSACATAPPARHAPPSPVPSEPGPPELRPLTSLRGWSAEDHAGALAAFRETCGAAKDPAMAEVCRSARAIGPLDDDRARRFFEANFRVEPLAGEGVLTAYFAPEYPARRKPDAEFSAAVRPRPADLKPLDAGDGAPEPYADRAEIEARPARDALAWMRPEDLFFLQVQGSGVLTFEDGQRLKALYAANNGRGFVGIANPMRDRGLLAADDTSAEAIHAWLGAHRGPDAEAIMRLNPRYAFFSLTPDDGRPPAGAAGLPLPAGRAVAIDPAYHALGELLWIDGESPILQGAFPVYRRIAMALDIGGAIKGEVRADLYLGQGAVAGTEAGRVRHTLRLYRLVPRTGP